MDGLTLLWGSIVSFGALLAWLINIARNDPALLGELARSFARPVAAILVAGPLLLVLGFAAYGADLLRTTEGQITLAVVLFAFALFISSRMLGRIASMPEERRPRPGGAGRTRRSSCPEEDIPSQRPASSSERSSEDARDPR